MKQSKLLPLIAIILMALITLPITHANKQILLFGQEGAGYILPLKEDTDGDGFPNWYEIKLGTNPLYNDENYFDEASIKLGLSQMELEELSKFVQINATNKYDAAVKVIDWVGKNIHYDSKLAQEMDNRPLYIGTRVRFPTQVAEDRTAICTGYTLLTDALLLNTHQFNTVYVIVFNCKGQRMGHATAAVQINGTFYVLDQHAPPVTLYYYLKHFWCDDYTAFLYKVTLHNGVPQVQYLGSPWEYAKPVNSTLIVENALRSWGTVKVVHSYPRGATEIDKNLIQTLGGFFGYYLNRELPDHPKNAQILIYPLKDKIAVKIVLSASKKDK